MFGVIGMYSHPQMCDSKSLYEYAWSSKSIRGTSQSCKTEKSSREDTIKNENTPRTKQNINTSMISV